MQNIYIKSFLFVFYRETYTKYIPRKVYQYSKLMFAMTLFLYSQVVSVVVQCESSLTQDDARLVGNGAQIKKAIEAIEKQHDQFSQLSPDQLSPDIPITFTKVTSFVKNPIFFFFVYIAHISLSHKFCSAKRTDKFTH